MSAAANAIDERLKTRAFGHGRPARGRRHVSSSEATRKSDEPLQLHERNHDLQDMNGLPLDRSRATSTGPFDATGPGDTPSRRRIFICRPESVREEAAVRRDASSRSSRARAYRRPVTQTTSTRCSSSTRGPRERHASTPASSRRCALILASPKFLFRSEPDPPAPRPARSMPVTDLELASRLSFFLWSTIPDDELLTVAAQGKLSEPAVLEPGAADARRIRRARAGRQLRGPVADAAQPAEPHPDAQRLPELRQRSCARHSAARPSCSSRASCARTAACSICSTADYTFVNERLARHYGIPNVYGSHFRRVTVEDDDAPRAARPGQHPDGDVVSEPHVAGAARQVDPREHPRHAAAAAAAERARRSRRTSRARQPKSRARAARAAPQQPGVRELSPRDGPARLRARELRRRSAHGARRSPAARSTRPGSWPTARRSTARWRCARR